MMITICIQPNDSHFLISKFSIVNILYILNWWKIILGSQSTCFGESITKWKLHITALSKILPADISNWSLFWFVLQCLTLHWCEFLLWEQDLPKLNEEEEDAPFSLTHRTNTALEFILHIRNHAITQSTDKTLKSSQNKFVKTHRSM